MRSQSGSSRPVLGINEEASRAVEITSDVQVVARGYSAAGVEGGSDANVLVMEDDAVTDCTRGRECTKEVQCPRELTQCKALCRCAAPVCNASSGQVSSLRCETRVGRRRMDGQGGMRRRAWREQQRGNAAGEGKVASSCAPGFVGPIQTAARWPRARSLVSLALARRVMGGR